MLVAAGLALVGIVAVAVVPLLGTAVLPTFADRNVLVRLEGQPGASNQWMTAKTTEVGSLLCGRARRGHGRRPGRPGGHRGPGGERQFQ